MSVADKTIVSVDDKTIVFKSDKRFSFFEFILGLVVIVALCAGYLWHWDGFWQYELPILQQTQMRYFPNKYAHEQDKKYNLNINMMQMEGAMKRIATLEGENDKLKTEISNLKRRNK